MNTYTRAGSCDTNTNTCWRFHIEKAEHGLLSYTLIHQSPTYFNDYISFLICESVLLVSAVGTWVKPKSFCWQHSSSLCHPSCSYGIRQARSASENPWCITTTATCMLCSSSMMSRAPPPSMGYLPGLRSAARIPSDRKSHGGSSLLRLSWSRRQSD